MALNDSPTLIYRAKIFMVLRGEQNGVFYITLLNVSFYEGNKLMNQKLPVKHDWVKFRI